jgi:hypothetical protein
MSFPLALLVLAGTMRTLAAQLPNTSASPSSPATAAATLPASTASLSGSITDSDGAVIPDAHITLAQPSHPSANTLSGADGQFTFTNLWTGTFTLSVNAAGFSPTHITGALQSGETREVPSIVLAAAASTDINVTASKTDIAQSQINFEEKQRVLGVFPNFYVSYLANPQPLDAKQKYELALRTMVDPVSFLLTGVTAGIQQAGDIYAWDQDAQGFGKRYAAAYGTFLTGNLLGNAVLPALLKQDPRYFYKTDGSVRSRILYALAMSVVCKGDNHRWQPDYSGIGGGIMASALSNAYYPAANRNGAGLIFANAAIGIGASGLQNIIQQFVVRRLTPHTHPATLAQP